MFRTDHHKPTAAWSAIMLAVGVGAVGAGCHVPQDPCVPGGETGKRYIAHLDEVYDSSVTAVAYQSSISRAMVTCAAVDFLDVGASIGFAVLASHNNLACFTHDASLDLASVQVMGDTTRIAGTNDVGSDLAVATKQVAIGSCSGRLEIDFRAPYGKPFDSRSPDRMPPFLVDRYFETTDAASCPALGVASGAYLCSDTWVATLTPL
jgi:hypothetical protein